MGKKAFLFAGPAFPANDLPAVRSVEPNVVMLGLAVAAAASLDRLFGDLGVKGVDHGKILYPQVECFKRKGRLVRPSSKNSRL